MEGTTTTSDLGMEAANRALAAAGVKKEEIDMIFFATLSPDYEFPGTAVFFQAKMDMIGIPAIDVRQQCTGFLHTMAFADQFIRTGYARKVLVVGAEIHSKGLDVSTRGRDLAVLFGDGAGSAVIGATEVNDPRRDPHIFSTHLHMDGRFARELWAQAPSQAYNGPRITHEILDRGEHYPRMNGRTVFMHAVKKMPEAVMEALDKNGMTLDLSEGLFSVVEFQHVKPGKGGAFVRTKLKNVRTGAVLERTFRADEKTAYPSVRDEMSHFLYTLGIDALFTNNPDQFPRQ